MRLDIQVDVFEHQVKPFAVARAIVLERHRALRRPADSWAVLEDDLRCFTREGGVFEHTLDRHDVSLNLDGLSHDPVERLGDLESIGHSQTDHSCRQLTASRNRNN